EADRDEHRSPPETEQRQDDEPGPDRQLQNDDRDAAVGEAEAGVDRTDHGEEDAVKGQRVGNERRPGDECGQASAGNSHDDRAKQHFPPSLKTPDYLASRFRLFTSSP